jgi:myotubularin-related protein 9
MPVIVHGTEGTDTTLVVTSLAQLLLDPATRTLAGFLSLIEREWVLAGHAFTTRSAHSVHAHGTTTGVHEAPTFLLFLDACAQVLHQYPLAFAFDERALLVLYDHALAGHSEYGTFLGDSERERAKADVRTHTHSLWTWMMDAEQQDTFDNPYFTPTTDVLRMQTVAQAMVNYHVCMPCIQRVQILWERMYLRWTLHWKQADNVRAMEYKWKHDEIQLREQVVQAMNELNDLRIRQVPTLSQVAVDVTS